MTWPACGPEAAKPEALPELLPRLGRDGSFSLYSRGCEEGFHSAAGALREANEKFVVPAALERFAPGRELVVAEVAVGTGEVDWPAFLAQLTTLGFTGDLCIEREAGEQRIEDIRAARLHLERLSA
jgi:hypothetical protein